MLSLGNLKTVRDVPIANRTIFLRTAYDLPLDGSKNILSSQRIKDDSRMQNTLATIIFLLKHKPRKILIAAGWMGRPDGEDPGYSMAPAVLCLRKLLKEKGYDVGIRLAPDCLDGSRPRSVYRNKEEVKRIVANNKGIILFENVRYDPEANQDKQDFAMFMASLAGKNALYVNEAEAQNHRPEATIKSVPKYIVQNSGDAVLGIQYAEVVKKIGGIREQLEHQERGPFIFFLSGKKIEVKPGITSKITVTKSLLDNMRKGDVLVIQGAVTYTFLLANHFYAILKEHKEDIRNSIISHNQCIEKELQKLSAVEASLKEKTLQKKMSEEIMAVLGIGYADICSLIGSSFRKAGQEGQQIFFAYQVMEKAKKRNVEVLLAKDHIISDKKPDKSGMLPVNVRIKRFDDSLHIPDGWLGVGPGPKTIAEIKERVNDSPKGYLLLAGPVSIEDPRVEEHGLANATLFSAIKTAKEKGWTTLAGGGDTAATINKYSAEDAFTMVSNAGGATLQLIEKGTSTGLEAIRSALQDKINIG